MVLDRYRDTSTRYLHPLAEGVERLGVSPNTVSAVSLLFAFAAGAAFALSRPGMPEVLVVASLFIAINGILDALDGHLARITDTASRRGDYLDHVIDRYADAAILVGLTFSPFVNPIWGVLAIVGTSLTSYMGTQAQALGLGRNYGGLLGRADRIAILITVPVLEMARIWYGYELPIGGSLLNVAMAYIAIVGNITAVQRFRAGWKELSDGEP